MSAFILTCGGTNGLKHVHYVPEGPPRSPVRWLGSREIANDNILAAGYKAYFNHLPDRLTPALRCHIEEFFYKKIIIIDWESAEIRAICHGTLAAASTLPPLQQAPLFCVEIIDLLSAMISYLGGIDVLVLNGEENRASTWKHICDSLGWLQLKLGDCAYLPCDRYISLPESAVAVLALKSGGSQPSFIIAG